MSEKVAQNPEPARDQVWHVAHMDAPFVIERTVERDGASRAESGYLTVGTIYLKAECRCIGLVTPHGRAMVGERRGSGVYQAATVTEIGDDGKVTMCGDNGIPWRSRADLVTSWPLIPPYAPAEQKIVASNQSGSPAYLRPSDSFERRPGSWSVKMVWEATSKPIPAWGSRSIPSTDPREQGNGISRLPPPEVRPDVVVTAAWEDRWTTP